jgi:DNA-binding response OmpR family regulator
MNIVIVEDNDNLREAVRGYLELEGYVVHEFAGIREAERRIKEIEPDLLILDVMLPDGDGFHFAKRLRATTTVPIIFLTARTGESDRITGLELGADDYVVKPFSTKELVLRVKAVLKRTASALDTASDVTFRLGDGVLEIRSDEHRVLLDGAPVSFTAAEWNILTFLVDHAPQVFDRVRLLESCLDSIAEGSERTIDTHIKNIRHKLGAREWIETVRGFGYRFNGIRS